MQWKAELSLFICTGKKTLQKLNFLIVSGCGGVSPTLHPVETATNSYPSQQDLPNNMIHQVPIKSLPQEWLWCETWCDDSSKKRAKTIDLVSAVQLPHSYVTVKQSDQL